MKKKASRAWKRPLAGLLTLAMVVCLLSSAPLSASASEIVEEPEVEVATDVPNPEGDAEGAEEANLAQEVKPVDETMMPSGENTSKVEEIPDGMNTTNELDDSKKSENENVSDGMNTQEGNPVTPEGEGGAQLGTENPTLEKPDESEETPEAAADAEEITEEEKAEALDAVNGIDFYTEGSSDDIELPEDVHWEKSKSKTATELDENFESQVTLSLPASDEQLVSDVVFVLDKSTSTDLREQAQELLKQLNAQVEKTQAKVKVGVVVFNKEANRVLELTELDKENLDTILTAINYTQSDGTNTHAGLLAGKAMLDSDSSVKANRKYLIFISDGITYMYGEHATAVAMENGEPVTSGAGTFGGPENWNSKYGSGTYIPEDWRSWLSSIKQQIEADGGKYEYSYGEEYSEYIPWSERTEHATSVDKALYLTYEAYMGAVHAGYHCYAMTAETPSAASNPWGPSFIKALGGGQDIDFTDIQNEIYYLLGTGSFVADYMGYVENDYNFDFVNEASALSMTVGETTYEAVPLGENQYGFAPNGSENGYDYILEYEENDRLANEHFVWTMNVPVSEFEPVSLTYSVWLVNPKAAPGTYGQYDEDGSEGYPGLYTNSKAILGAIDSNGDLVSSQEEFAKPTVSYTVEEPTEPVDPDPGEPEDSVKIDKTATELDAQDQTKVTLSVGADQETIESNVVFVLDKSTSTNVRAEAGKMLEALLAQAEKGNVINVAVVAFEKSATVVQEWTVLNSENITVIKDAINNKKNESGTNIYLGLTVGKELLDAKKGGDNHLVLVTDGITYLWGGENDSDAYSIYTEQIDNGCEAIQAGNDMMPFHHGDLENYYAEFDNIAQWYADHGGQIAEDIETYQHVYQEGQYNADEKYQQENSTYVNAGFYQENNDYIPGEIADEHFGANDAAVYKAVTVWKEILEAGYHAYAYADTTSANAGNAASFPWGSKFIGSLDTLGGSSKVISDNEIEGMFNDVKNTILYEIMSGTVTDVIGNNFDLTSVGNFELTAGGEILAPTIFGNTVYFGTQTGNEYSYSVTYYPNGTNGDSREQFVWDINVPVESAKPLELTYTLKLVNKETAEGSYTVPTNEDATLTYESTDGGNGSEKFPKPEVTYTVTAGGTETPTTPSDPGSGSGGSSDSGSGSSSGSSSSPTQTTSAQTGDETNILLPVVTLIIAAAVLGTAGTVYYKKKRG